MEQPSRVGRYQVLRELGRGGHGVVFLAFDPSLRRRVALKLPGAAVLATPALRERFQREAVAASRLDHPHIVPVFEAGHEGMIHYIATAYCDGPTLGAWLRGRVEPVPPRMAAELGVNLARAVHHAHERGVIHRDLKPSNILLDGEADRSTPVPRITDFGLAKLLDEEGGGDQTGTGAVLGSPPYMAPEQAEGRTSEIGAATDVYALGTILYEILTGNPAFRGESRADTIRLVVAADPTPPRRLRAGLPRDLETIVLTCMARSPVHRYRSAAALADDLDRFRRGEPIQARPAFLVRRAWAWSRRRPGPAAVIGLVLALVVGLVGYQAQLSVHNLELRHAIARAELGEKEARRQNDLVTRYQDVLRRRIVGYQVRQAQREHELGRDETAQLLLESARREIRADVDPGFAWSYLRRATSRQVELLGGHEGEVLALAWSPDGRFLASGDTRGSILIRDRATGRSWTTARPHSAMIRRLVWSPDGRSLAATSFPNSGPPESSAELIVWDAATGRERAAVDRLGLIPHELWFTPDGTGLVARWPSRAGMPSRIQGWRFDLGSRCSLVPTSDGDEALRRAELTDDRLEAMARVLDGDDPRDDSIRDVWDGTVPPGLAFTRDGRLTVQGRGDGSFSIHHRENADPIALGRYSRGGLLLNHVFRDASDPRGLVTAADRDRMARLGQIAARDGDPPLLVTIAASNGREAAAFSRDGSFFAHWEPDVHAIRLHDVASGREIGCLAVGNLDSVSAVAMSPDGRCLAFGSNDHMVRIRPLDEKPERPSLPGHAPAETWSVAWSSDGRKLYSGGDDHLVRAWDVATGLLEASWPGHESLVTRVAMAPDGLTLASASFDRTIRLWDIRTGTARAILRGHTGRARAVAWSPDGRTLASLDTDNTVLQWDAATGQLSGGPLRDSSITRSDDLAYAPDGRALIHGAGNALAVWDLETLSLQLVPVPTALFVRAVAYGPRGGTIAMGCGDGRVLLHDLATGQTWPVQGAHAREVFDLTFSPDGLTLASCGMDATVRLWDISTREEVLALPGPDGPFHGVAFDPSGHSLAAASHLGPIRLWHGHGLAAEGHCPDGRVPVESTLRIGADVAPRSSDSSDESKN